MINHNSVFTIRNIKYIYSVFLSSDKIMAGTSYWRTENRRYFIFHDKWMRSYLPQGVFVTQLFGRHEIKFHNETGLLLNYKKNITGTLIKTVLTSEDFSFPLDYKNFKFTHRLNSNHIILRLYLLIYSSVTATHKNKPIPFTACLMNYLIFQVVWSCCT